MNLRKKVTKSIVAKKNLYSGKILKFNDITFKRPGTGITPLDYKKIINKKLIKNVIKNQMILKKDVR